MQTVLALHRRNLKRLRLRLPAIGVGMGNRIARVLRGEEGKRKQQQTIDRIAHLRRAEVFVYQDEQDQPYNGSASQHQHQHPKR